MCAGPYNRFGAGSVPMAKKGKEESYLSSSAHPIPPAIPTSLSVLILAGGLKGVDDGY